MVEMAHMDDMEVITAFTARGTMAFMVKEARTIAGSGNSAGAPPNGDGNSDDLRGLSRGATAGKRDAAAVGTSSAVETILGRS
jgi:hypothetical protein